MERNYQKHGLVNLMTLLVIGVMAYMLARIGGSSSGQLAALFMGVGALVALVSWFQMRLEERERLEQMEFEELTRAKGSSALFQTQDAEAFPARHSREQFQRWVVPVFTVIVALIEAFIAFGWWRYLGLPEVQQATLKQPTVTMSLFGLFFLILFLVGRFTSAISRLEEARLLRAGASFLLLGAYSALLVAGAVAGVLLEVPTLDHILARIFAGFFALFAVETVISLVFELYRPRVKGRLVRPIYESRLIGLFAHPEGVFSTAAHALDYQFGFKVSETWFYQFFRRALGWLILLQAGALFLSTCVVFIEPGERGLLERWGKLVESRGDLQPGAHFKYPWPVDNVKRYPTEQIRTFIIGSQPETNQMQMNTIFWNVKHTKEEFMLVGNREQRALTSTNQAGDYSTPPVSMLTVSFPLQFEITDLKAWAYNNTEPEKLLDEIATREVIHYLANSDIEEVLAMGRLEAAKQLREAIQASADKRQLGVRVNFIGLQDIHPPTEVAESFQKVVAARQEKEAAILDAGADAIRTNTIAGAVAFKDVAEAESFRTRAEVNLLARTALFTNQIPAYHAAPDYYMERAYLQAFTRGSTNARKYVMLTTNTHDVLQFDLQEKFGRDFSDLTVPPPD